MNANGAICGQGKRTDLIGMRFGMLEVIACDSSGKRGRRWKCRCECGAMIVFYTKQLTIVGRRDCGCVRRRGRKIDLTGKRFGRLQVIGYEISRDKLRHWKCLCDCGETTIVVTHRLTGGGTRSCGCLHSENFRKGDESRFWRGDEATTDRKRARARSVYALGKCERCDAPATDRHHKDANTGNNKPSNIERLCRRCHMIVDGRLERFRALPKQQRRQPPKPCVNCGRPDRKLAHGRCNACSKYFRIHGKERPPIQTRLNPPKREPGPQRKAAAARLMTEAGQNESLDKIAEDVGSSYSTVHRVYLELLAQGMVPRRQIGGRP